MSIVKITLPLGELPVNGKQITFTAPCASSDTEALQIEGVNYTVVDALCNCVTGNGGRWQAGAVVSVILDTEKKYAYIQNGNYTADQVTVTAETASALGLNNGASVDNALAKLSNAALLKDSDTPTKVLGKDWSSAATGFSYTPVLTDMVYGGGKFVGVRNASVNCISTDGITWEEVNSPYSLRKIAYGAGKYVALGSEFSAKAYHSEDAINWTEISVPATYPGAITYGGGKFVILPYSGTNGAYSEDGINWTRMTVPGYGGWQQIAYGDGLFMSVYGDGSDHNGTVTSSPDGITWTTTAGLSYDQYWRGIAYGDGIFVAAQMGTTFAYYKRGSGWISINHGVSHNWDRVVYGDGKFIVFGVNTDKTLVYKPGDTTCTAVNLPKTNSGRGMAFGNNKLAIVLDSTTAAYTETVYPKELVDALGNIVDIGSAKIETGSYVGVGRKGNTEKSSLTLSFAPKILIILCGSQSIAQTPFIYIDGMTTMGGLYLNGSTAASNPIVIERNGNTITWYSNSNVSSDNTQFDYSGYTYKYIAIG